MSISNRFTTLTPQFGCGQTQAPAFAGKSQPPALSEPGKDLVTLSGTSAVTTATNNAGNDPLGPLFAELTEQLLAGTATCDEYAVFGWSGEYHFTMKDGTKVDFEFDDKKFAVTTKTTDGNTTKVEAATDIISQQYTPIMEVMNEVIKIANEAAGAKAELDQLSEADKKQYAPQIAAFEQKQTLEKAAAKAKLDIIKTQMGL